MATFTGSNAGEILPSLILGPVQALGDDEIFALGGDDIAVGYSGDDIIDGGAGADLIIGGVLSVIANIGTVSVSGNDTADYSQSLGGVSVDLFATEDLTLNLLGLEIGLSDASTGSGGDAEGDILVGIANLTGSASADILTGNAATNVIRGGAGNDILNGGLGIDSLDGGVGDDLFFVDEADDEVFEAAGGGTDRVVASVSYVLAAGEEVETMETVISAATTAINLTGNEFDQRLNGNAGDNMLNGRGGDDIMRGLGGSDTYFVESAGDQVVEIGGAGNDRIISTISYALVAGQEVERLEAFSSTATTTINFTGNEIANTLIGNNGNNILNGKAGADLLRGNGGEDAFLFDSALGGGNVDTIVDFVVLDDTIRLENLVFTGVGNNGTLGSDVFTANATGTAADAEDRIIYETDTGRLSFDADGAGGVAAIHFATITANFALTNADFLVV